MNANTTLFRLPFRCFSLTGMLLVGTLALAQTPAALPGTNTPTTPTERPGVEQRTERIHIEDNSTIIDEVRIGGETKSIDVKPKGVMPAYQVAPTSGERSWKVLGF